jgi:hypothetical protein
MVHSNMQKWSYRVNAEEERLTKAMKNDDDEDEEEVWNKKSEPSMICPIITPNNCKTL